MKNSVKRYTFATTRGEFAVHTCSGDLKAVRHLTRCVKTFLPKSGGFPNKDILTRGEAANTIRHYRNQGVTVQVEIF